jgi:RNA polymerase sigma factor (sigma-70 family)
MKPLVGLVMDQRAQTLSVGPDLGDVYQQFYERHRPAVRQRSYRRLSRYRLSAAQQTAEDLCQETFHAVYRWMRNFWEQHGHPPSEEVFVRVLKTIEINEYRTHLKRANYPIHELNAGAGEPTSAEESVASADLSPEEELLWKEYEERIQHCLKKLKSTERSALLLKLVGHSDKEISDLLGETPKKVMFTIVPLGRRKLRKCMMGYIHGQRT